MKKGFFKRIFLAGLVGFQIGKYISNNKEQKHEPEQTKIEDTVDMPIYNEPYKKEIPKHLRKEYQALVEVPDNYYEEIMRNLSTEDKYVVMMNKGISEGSLSELKKLRLDPTVKSLDFLEYCTSLEYLHIAQYDEEIMNVLPQLPSVKKLAMNINEFDKTTKELLDKKMPNINEMDISCTLEFEPDVIEKMNNLKKLTIGPKQNCDIDFKKLTNLEGLKIASTEPYNIAIWLNKEEYLTLKESGVKITFAENVENKYLEILEKIEEVIKKLNIDAYSTDKEKYNKIVIYILENMKYDKEVIEMSNKEDKDENEFSELIRSFYKDGMLYAALESDTQICGNYSALFEALCDRIYAPEQAYLLLSKTHAWNMIKLDGISYYTDLTWLDDQYIWLDKEKITVEDAIKQGLENYLFWYLEYPDSPFVELENEQNDYHTPRYTPEHFENETLGNQKIKKRFDK